MSDLETQLRSMLAERAQDVTTVPARITDLDAESHDPRPRNTRLWLVAAAIVAVLAIVGGAVLLNRSTAHRTAPVGPTSTAPDPSASSSAPTTPTSPHAARQVRLSWFGMAALSGYTTLYQSSDPGVRMRAIHKDGDQGAPPGCNGCGTPPPSAAILVYDQGRFHLGSGWTPTTLAGARAYFGTTNWAQKHPVPSLAWEFRPGEWAIVQGLTAATRGRSQLRHIAAAVRPAQDVAIELPFRLGYVPGLPITHVDDNRPMYAANVTFGSVEGRTFSISLTVGRSLAGHFDTTGATKRTIGGLPGYYSPNEGIGVAYHDGVATLGIGEPSGPTTAADRADLLRIAANLHWTNGDGRAPLVPMEQAIP